MHIYGGTIWVFSLNHWSWPKKSKIKCSKLPTNVKFSQLFGFYSVVPKFYDAALKIMRSKDSETWILKQFKWLQWLKCNLMCFLAQSQAAYSLSGVQCFVLTVNSQKYFYYNSCLKREVSSHHCILVNFNDCIHKIIACSQKKTCKSIV